MIIRSREVEFFACPNLADVKGQLPPHKVFIKAFCQAGCGTEIVYPIEGQDEIPKVCHKCADWLANPEGTA